MNRLCALSLVLAAVTCRPPAPAPLQPVPSGVNRRGGESGARDGRVARPVLAGSTTDLEELRVHAVTLSPSGADERRGDAAEVLVIVTDGLLRVAMNGESKALGPGSVALSLPGEAYRLTPADGRAATYYEFVYRSKAPVDLARGRTAGGSFMVDWNDVAFRPSATGGRRNVFDRPTAMFRRFEMHVTTLNAGLTNHPAHTHRAEEMVLMRSGDVRLLVGETWHGATAGDLVFLASQIPHSLQNTGSVPTEYFAFQGQ